MCWLELEGMKCTLLREERERENQNQNQSLCWVSVDLSVSVAVSQFRVCVLWRTRPLWSSKASPSETLFTSSAVLEHFLVASPDVLPLRHDFCRPGPQKWQSTPRDVTIFSVSFFFFGHAKNLGICEEDRSGASSKTGKRRSNWRSLQIGTTFTPCWHMQTLNWDTAAVLLTSSVH